MISKQVALAGTGLVLFSNTLLPPAETVSLPPKLDLYVDTFNGEGWQQDGGLANYGMFKINGQWENVGECVTLIGRVYVSASWFFDIYDDVEFLQPLDPKPDLTDMVWIDPALYAGHPYDPLTFDIPTFNGFTTALLLPPDDEKVNLWFRTLLHPGVDQGSPNLQWVTQYTHWEDVTAGFWATSRSRYGGPEDVSLEAMAYELAIIQAGGALPPGFADRGGPWEHARDKGILHVEVQALSVLGQDVDPDDVPESEDDAGPNGPGTTDGWQDLAKLPYMGVSNTLDFTLIGTPPDPDRRPGALSIGGYVVAEGEEYGPGDPVKLRMSNCLARTRGRFKDSSGQQRMIWIDLTGPCEGTFLMPETMPNGQPPTGTGKIDFLSNLFGSNSLGPNEAFVIELEN